MTQTNWSTVRRRPPLSALPSPITTSFDPVSTQIPLSRSAPHSSPLCALQFTSTPTISTSASTSTAGPDSASTPTTRADRIFQAVDFPDVRAPGDMPHRQTSPSMITPPVPPLLPTATGAYESDTSSPGALPTPANPLAAFPRQAYFPHNGESSEEDNRVIQDGNPLSPGTTLSSNGTIRRARTSRIGGSRSGSKSRSGSRNASRTPMEQRSPERKNGSAHPLTFCPYCATLTPLLASYRDANPNCCAAILCLWSRSDSNCVGRHPLRRRRGVSVSARPRFSRSHCDVGRTGLPSIDAPHSRCRQTMMRARMTSEDSQDPLAGIDGRVLPTRLFSLSDAVELLSPFPRSRLRPALVHDFSRACRMKNCITPALLWPVSSCLLLSEHSHARRAFPHDRITKCLYLVHVRAPCGSRFPPRVACF